MDLHALTRRYGSENVAEIMGRTERSLTDARRGAAPLTIDDFLRLVTAFPGFDLEGTIRQIGQVREEKGWARPHKK
jgi:hypothetical protein